MDILLVIQDPGSVDGCDADFIPLDIVHIILIDSELRAS